jgi:hypothetical protein
VLADPTSYWIVAGATTVIAPWLLDAASHGADLAGQLMVYGGARGDFLRPGFYLANLLSEPARFYHLHLLQPNAQVVQDPEAPDSPVSLWLLMVGSWAALAYVAWRCRSKCAVGDRLLCASLLTFAALLVLLDQTKTPLYAIVLLPSLCLALAAFWTGVVSWLWVGSRHTWQRLAAAALSLGLLASIALEGGRAYQFALVQSERAGHYLGVGQQIERALDPGATVLGPERWWWALHDHRYLSLRSLWFQWTIADVNGHSPRFVDWVAWSKADSIVVNDNVRGDVLAFSTTLQRQFQAFLDSCTTRTLDLDDVTYLQIEVYAISRPSPRPELCGG